MAGLALSDPHLFKAAEQFSNDMYPGLKLLNVRFVQGLKKIPASHVGNYWKIVIWKSGCFNVHHRIELVCEFGSFIDVRSL